MAIKRLYPSTINLLTDFKMKDKIIQDSLNVANQVVNHSVEKSELFNFWSIVAIVEFFIIIFLVFKGKINLNQSAKSKFKEESLKQEIDFNNIINSSFNSKHLYDELKVKCHPDRFPSDNEKIAYAESLFQEISKNRTNVKRLTELKEEAIQKLNINF